MKHAHTQQELRELQALPLAHGRNRLPYIKARYPKLYETFINKLGLGAMFKRLGLKYE